MGTKAIQTFKYETHSKLTGKVIFETLEPRILLSADPFPGIDLGNGDAFSDAINSLSNPAPIAKDKGHFNNPKQEILLEPAPSPQETLNPVLAVESPKAPVSEWTVEDVKGGQLGEAQKNIQAQVETIMETVIAPEPVVSEPIVAPEPAMEVFALPSDPTDQALEVVSEVTTAPFIEKILSEDIQPDEPAPADYSSHWMATFDSPVISGFYEPDFNQDALFFIDFLENANPSDLISSEFNPMESFDANLEIALKIQSFLEMIGLGGLKALDLEGFGELQGNGEIFSDPNVNALDAETILMDSLPVEMQTVQKAVEDYPQGQEEFSNVQIFDESNGELTDESDIHLKSAYNWITEDTLQHSKDEAYSLF